MSGLALSAQAIGGAHLWREKRLLSPRVFISDALQAEIARQSLRLPKRFRVREARSSSRLDRRFRKAPTIL